jgi:hypothetical protein
MSIEEIIKSEERFKYQMLGRFISDMQYCINTKSNRHLWAGTTLKHYNYTIKLFNSFSAIAKPRWTSARKIYRLYQLLLKNEGETTK